MGRESDETWGVGAVVIAVLLGTTPAIAQPATSSTAQTITATGTAQTRVVPKNRHSNASIAAAVEKAHKPVKGQKPKFKRVHRCIVPQFSFATLTVTYAASS